MQTKPHKPVELQSSLDESVNFVWDQPDQGYFESRYVRRSQEKVVVYLSSQSGCAMGCRMCHLTATKQTTLRNATVDELLGQASHVLDWYASHCPQAERVHFNFMARGEPLSNPLILGNAESLTRSLEGLGHQLGLRAEVLISTIMPRGMRDRSLPELFGSARPRIYYSLYSIDPEFRKRWLPRTLDPQLALAKCAEYQREGGTVRLHWAFIEGENDDAATIERIANAVHEAGLHPDINVVRYNPFGSEHGREPPAKIIEERVKQLSGYLPSAQIKIIDRIGFDVQASCGMFVPAELTVSADQSESQFGRSAQ
ncbi:MAG: radical SAM enzyme, Cfr family protein [Planctomycetota bacterium]